MVNDIVKYLGLYKPYSVWISKSYINFRDLYNHSVTSERFLDNKFDFLSYQSWEKARWKAFVIALLETMLTQGSSLTISTQIIMVIQALFEGIKKGDTTNYFL